MSQSDTPQIGTPYTFTRDAAPTLAGIPATVITVHPRMRSGDYLVTLEYRQPIRLRGGWAQHVDALLSELEPVAVAVEAGR